jgi:flagellin-like hook-associated protein FlgL
MAIDDVKLTAAMRSNLLLLQRTDSTIQKTQNKLATGLKISSALDGPTEFFAAKGLNTRANDLSKLKDAMGQAVSTIKAADKGISSIESFMEQMRGLTTAALGSLGTDAASVATRKTLAEQFNTLKGQIDKMVSDSGYQGKNLLAGNGLRLDSTSTSRQNVNSITGLSNARVTNVVSADTYTIRISGDGDITGNATDITEIEADRGFVSLKVSGTMSSTLGGFSDISFTTRGSAGKLRTFTVTDGNESRVVQFFDDNQTAETSLITAARSGVSQVSQVALSGTVEEGDIFKITVEGITFKYTATAADASAGDAVARVATQLQASIQAAITSGRLSSADFAATTQIALTVNGTGTQATISVTGNASTNSSNDFIISSTTTNALSKRISESFASGAVVSFTIDRLAMEAAGNGTSVLEKNVNLQISVTNLAGDVVTRDANNERGSSKLADGENSFQFDTGTVRIKVDEEMVQQAASAQAAANIITRQVADANTQNDLTVQFNERNTSNITVLSQNVSTSGQGMRLDYAQNDWLDRDDIEHAVKQLDFAKQHLRDASQSLSTNLNIVTTREEFTKEFSDVLVEGANKLTLADQNEEGTKMLMLQTRQQLGTISLTISNQQQQAILRLF